MTAPLGVRQVVRGPATARTQVARLIVVATTARLVLAATIGLGVDESYAVTVSRRLSLSYFDHPPLSFWIPGLLGKGAGQESAVLLRLPFILLFAATTWLVYRLGARLFGERAGWYAALTLTLAPVLSVTTGGWVLPDGPLVFFMAAAALCLTRVLITRDVEHPTRWWLAAGACTALALLSKYHGIFLLFGAGLFLLTTPGQRHWLRRPAPWLAAGVAALGAVPVIAWNATHAWASFRFQGGRAELRHGGHVAALLENLAGQAAYFLPWLWVPLVCVLVAALVRGARDERRWLLACLAVGPIAGFTLVALGGSPGLPHWPAPGYLFLFPMLGAAIDARLARGDERARRWLAFSIAAFVAVVALAASEATTGWLEGAAPSMFTRGDPMLEVVDWRALRPALAAEMPALRRHAAFIGAVSWIEAGKAGYALGPHVDVVCLCARPHQFRWLHDDTTFVGRDAILIERAGTTPPASVRYAPFFHSVVPLDSVEIRHGGHVALTLALYRATALRTPAADAHPP